MPKSTETTYTCEICKTKPDQLSHNKKHCESESHKDKCKIFKLTLNKNTVKKLKELYTDYKNLKTKKQIIDKIVEDMSSVKRVIEKEINIPTNKYNLKSWIHDIHNFLRNSGAGYGMKPLNIFSLFYGLMRLEEYDMLLDVNLTDEKMFFSNLVKLSNESKTNENMLSDLINIIRDNNSSNILDTLYGNTNSHPLRDTLFYEIPKHITPSIFAELILRIDTIKDIEKNTNIQLSGKVYEYFIGRDDSAISALGAFFTDRPIPKLVYSKILNIKLNDNKSIPSIIDPFGGSGGFIIEFIEYINKHYSDVNWKDNIDNLYHYDMNEDVVKISALEIMCLTKIKTNINGTINSFKFDFNNKRYMIIVSNPPYGGDSFDSELIQPLTVLLVEIKKRLKNEKNNHKLKVQQKRIENEIKSIRKNHTNNIVSVSNSSKRIQDYAEKHKLIGTCKEVVSMILFMDLLEEGGTACIVMKQGFFFDKSKQYVDIRTHLLNNFNVTKIIKIPEGSFENTNCVTSIIVFHKKSPTTSIEFSDLIVNENTETKFDIDENGDIFIKEFINDINNVEYKVVKTISKEIIKSNSIVSFDMCDYANFEIIENKKISNSVNILEIIDINHINDKYTNISVYKDFNIGCIEKNKIIKTIKEINVDEVKSSHILNENDIIISCCRPNCDKTRLITKEDIVNGYSSNIPKIKVKNKYCKKYPPIYIYSILYQIIGEKSQKGFARNNAERMFAKSTSYPTIKLEMFKHIQIPLHKKQNIIDIWVKKLNSVYDNSDMTKFKEISSDMFSELIDKFIIYSR